MTRTSPRHSLLRQPSWLIVIVAGTLVVVFLVAIVREFINGHQVRQQVQRLQAQVAVAKNHQHQLQDLIDYLGSPTFQEREARLQLGLKKNGERVIVVPPSTTSGNGAVSSTGSGSPDLPADASRPARWWAYFFGAPHSSSSSS